MNLLKQNITFKSKTFACQFNKPGLFSSQAIKFFSSDSDKDFQPQINKDLTNDNVMKEIDSWIKENDVVVFMKGTKEMPRCGYSNYLVQVLKFYKINNYKDVNVLSSDILRQSIKDYSNWPTFPQLYIKGELIGGCDIVKEMHENGSFQELVEKNNLL